MSRGISTNFHRRDGAREGSALYCAHEVRSPFLRLRCRDGHAAYSRMLGDQNESMRDVVRQQQVAAQPATVITRGFDDIGASPE